MQLRAWLRDPRRCSAGALLGGWFYFFAPQLWSDGVPYFRDALLTYYPILVYLRERLLHGELPQWYPYEALGSPFIGQVVTQTFYPLTYLLLPFAAATALKILVLGSYLAALFGAYRWARCFTARRPAAVGGAFAYAFGGYALSMSSNPNYLLAVATLPWVGWAAWRLVSRTQLKDVGVLAICWAMLFLTGDVQTFLVVAAVPLFAVMSFGFTRKRVAALALAVGLTSLVIAIELVPALILDRGSLRTIGTPGAGHGLIWALHPARLFGLVIGEWVPDSVRIPMARALFGGQTSFWAMSVFAGVATIVLALGGAVTGGKRRWVGLTLAALGLWLALGNRGYLLPALWKIAPTLAQFRYPEKYLVFFWLGLVPLVSLGIEAAGQGRRAIMGIALALAASLLALFVTLQLSHPVDFLWRSLCCTLPSGSPLPTTVNPAWAQSALFGLLFALAVAVVSWRSRAGRDLTWLLPVLIGLELVRVNNVQAALVDRSYIEAPVPLLERIAHSGEDGAPPARVIRASTRPLPALISADNREWVARSRASAFPDTNGPSHVSVFGFELPAESARYALALGPGGDRQRALGPVFNGCFRLEDVGAPPVVNAVEVGREDSLGYLAWHIPCAPRAYLSSARQVRDIRAASSALPNLRDPEQAFWEGGPVLASGGGTVHWLEYRPEHLVLDVDAQTPSALVVNDLYSPGWSAVVDQRPAPVYPTNVAVRGIPIPTGRHHVELTYRAPGMVLGTTLTSLGFLAILFCFFAHLFKRHRQKPVAA